jgi:hypothetical protein
MANALLVNLSFLIAADDCAAQARVAIAASYGLSLWNSFLRWVVSPTWMSNQSSLL